MATWVIGDIHGCARELDALLIRINYHPQRDALWFCGDLVNRGPQSLIVLRRVREVLQARSDNTMVLGNHDLHLLGVYAGARQLQPQDTLYEILTASDVGDLMQWLRCQPLIHWAPHCGCLLVHAGVLPVWNITQTLSLAEEVRRVLVRKHDDIPWRELFGNQPTHWSGGLEGAERWRFIINVLTRMRYLYVENTPLHCGASTTLNVSQVMSRTHAQGTLDFSCTEPLTCAPRYLTPWFSINQDRIPQRIVFGHWAALNGRTGYANRINLDTGCAWGGGLTAFNLDTQDRVCVPRIRY